jgi:hypothetical protein
MERMMEGAGVGRGAGTTAGGRAGGGAVAGKIDWFRFWRDMAIAALVFNVVAGLVTWYYIFPLLGLR